MGKSLARPMTYLARPLLGEGRVESAMDAAFCSLNVNEIVPTSSLSLSSILVKNRSVLEIFGPAKLVNWK